MDDLPAEWEIYSGWGHRFPSVSRMLIVERGRACYYQGKSMEHAVRKPVESRHAYEHRRKTLILGMLVALAIAGALAVLLVG